MKTIFSLFVVFTFVAQSMAQTDSRVRNLTATGTVTAAAFVGGTLQAGASTLVRLLGVCDASTYSGSDAGAKINAAMSDSTCVAVDASNFVSPTAAATITVSKPLIIGVYTLATSGNPGISVGNNVFLVGKGRSYSIVSTTSATADIIKVPSSSQGWGVFDLAIQSSVLRTAGAGLRISGGNGIAQRLLINPVFDGITFDTAILAGLNSVTDVEIGDGFGVSPGAGAAWHCGVKHGGVSSGTVASNYLNTVNIVMFTAFTDAGLCIQDGTDSLTVVNSQIVANVGGSDSVAVHYELVNGGAAPSNVKINHSTVEGGPSKNSTVVDSGLNIIHENVTSQTGLRGLLINSCNACRFSDGTFHNNAQEGVRVVSQFNTQITGNRFSDNSQQTTNTFDDIFVAANNQMFTIRDNMHADFVSTGKICKWGIEVAAGTSNNYIIQDINPGSCGTGALTDGGTGASKFVCTLGSVCNLAAADLLLSGNITANSLGNKIGFGGDLAAARSNTTGVWWLGADGAVSIDRGVTSSGQVTLLGAPLNITNLGVGALAIGGDGILENNSNLTGPTQIGIQAAPQCSSASTSGCEGGRFRADTAAASFTTSLLDALHVVSGIKGASSTITTEVGVDIDTLSNGSTTFALRTGANTSQFGGQIKSTVSTSTAPLIIASTTPVANLTVQNCDTCVVTTSLTSPNYRSASNCSSSASPAVCGSAPAGSFVIAALGTSVTVNTTAVTANSQILLQEDSSLGTKLGVTCNTGIIASPPIITARTAGTSFTVGISLGLATNPVCFSFFLVN